MGQFIIRVYGLIVNNKNEILLSDEFVLNTKMTKFPGGGLEFGEGLIDGLKREFEEECNGQQLKNIRHFYTTDFYQKALYFENAQLISIYFLADLHAPLKFRITNKAFDFEIEGAEQQSFRWEKIKDLKESDITFPIDKFVLNKLKETFDV
ncbi:NUDIX domain-containing protein [uncultured Draconibacterium sp.]|uniref:NUDIX domain-containing protein n=1 Tax=uncultured Draconibacterium sp. TaxID=1573823 RepID=UPI0025E81179|nr:NUDIX domain-containing protein [uncultured Draconibacterium sp.]